MRARRQASYLQIRGSVPILWSQTINLKYKPVLKVDVGERTVRALGARRGHSGRCANVADGDARGRSRRRAMLQQQAFTRHMDDLCQRYGDQIVFSLIDTKGYELSVGNAFKTVVERAQNKRITYVPFADASVGYGSALGLRRRVPAPPRCYP